MQKKFHSCWESYGAAPGAGLACPDGDKRQKLGDRVQRLKTALSAGLLAASTLAIAAAMPVSARAAGTLIWGMPAETDILDPHATGGWSTYQVTYQIFEG